MASVDRLALAPRERLAELWRTIERGDSGSYSAVIVPSLSFDPVELTKISGVSFYEERLLFLLMRLRDPAARVLYVTSQPIPQEIVDYYLDLLVGVPARHARSRLMMLSVYDARPLPLTQKILERPRVVERIRTWIGDPDRAYLSCFNTSDLERRLAGELGIALNGVDPELLPLGTKSGCRKLFREAGVPLPEGFEDIRSRAAAVAALVSLRDKVPTVCKAVIKLNSSFSGEGNAVFTYPVEDSPAAIDAALENLKWTAASERAASFFSKIEEQGGIVERFLDAAELRSPSVQMRITPTGKIVHVSTHEQILGGATGQAYMGCRFPADDAYRARLREAGHDIAQALRDKGVVSRFAVDFVVWRDTPESGWQFAAIEVNLRLGGTTFPFLALEFLTDGQLDHDGLFVSDRGTHKYYVATDALISPRYRGLLPQDLLDLMIEHRLIFDPGTETGVLFHMIGALSQYGKLGVIAIGDSPEQAQAIFDETRAVLDRETGISEAAVAGPGVALPRTARRLD